ncbi:Uncharacterized protein dnm_026440 [Desulfonema magnum]|uniref:Uncharacterized protein n=1 Tax=Desulfonema magnum TaxID=45655 RepID=A0A975BK78_9BACT|nr:Uncharacterized protein dnm_026440 [Desulfonema magnum]
MSPRGALPHMHQAKTAGRGLQPRPKRLFSGVGKYFGRGCKPRPADHELIKTMSYDLSLMHMGLCLPKSVIFDLDVQVFAVIPFSVSSDFGKLSRTVGRNDSFFCPNRIKKT